MALKLIGYPVSPFVRKVRVALAEKSIPYELDPVVPYTDREKVLPYNPAGTVPVLVLGDETQPIPESADIVAWADAQIPEPRLIPTASDLKQRALQAQQFADRQMAQVFGGMMFGQRIVVAYYFGKGRGNENVVQQAMDQLAAQLLDTVSEFLGSADFVAGDFSVGDIALSSWLRGANIAGFELDAAKWPEISAWLERCFKQPGYAKIIEEEEALEVVQWAREKYTPST